MVLSRNNALTDVFCTPDRAIEPSFSEKSGFSLVKTRVIVCRRVTIPRITAPHINEPVWLPSASNLSKRKASPYVNAIPPKSETISFIAVKAPRFSSFSMDIYQSVLGALTALCRICATRRAITSKADFICPEQAASGTR